MTVELSNQMDAARKVLNSYSRRQERSKIGQFLTPAKIARFMASMFVRQREEVRILDAGAGAGVLFTACIENLVSGKHRPSSVKVVAYENDEQVLPYLKEAMERCRAICREYGVSFQGQIRKEDFIPAGIVQTDEGLFSIQQEQFTHAIVNPPYKKINGQSSTRRSLEKAGIEVSNLYAAFVWLIARMLEPGGELVAITPRSFCNGPYFRQFRIRLLTMMSLRWIHVFESRKKAFGDDQVLQENIIFHAIRGGRKPERLTLSSSDGLDFEKASSRSVPYEQVVDPGDRDAFMRLILKESDTTILEQMRGFTTSLERLGLEVSTGRIVDFRSKEYLRPSPEEGTVPLIYPCHFEDGFIKWPVESGRKPNAIQSSLQTSGFLVPAGYFVLTKRFSAKEERRRVMAAIYDPNRIPSAWVGFENHLNFFHTRGKGILPNLAKGLALYLNSSLFDRYFRFFSGHTQVNATDLRKIRYPSWEQLIKLGSHVKQRMPEQGTIDTILDKECPTHD